MGVTMKELRGVPPAELSQRVEQTRREIGAIRLKGKQGVLEQPHRIRLMRRDMARMLTVLNEAHS